MGLGREGKLLLVYYLASYAYLYGINAALRPILRHIAGDVLKIALINVSTLTVLCALAYTIVSKGLGGGRFREYLGLRRRGLWDSLVITGGAFAGLYLTAALVAFAFLKMDPVARFVENARAWSAPWFDNVDPTTLPIVAIAMWLASGVFWFGLLQAFPYEVLIRRPKKVVIPLISLSSVLLYNAPLLTGEWKVDDIVFLGVLCPLIYHLTRNSVGIILNYVFLFELPVAAAFLRGWGEAAFSAFLALRMAWGVLRN